MQIAQARITLTAKFVDCQVDAVARSPEVACHKSTTLRVVGLSEQGLLGQVGSAEPPPKSPFLSASRRRSDMSARDEAKEAKCCAAQPSEGCGNTRVFLRCSEEHRCGWPEIDRPLSESRALSAFFRHDIVRKMLPKKSVE